MIARVRIENFKLLRSVALELDRLAVIVGRNGVGKSSVLEAVDLLLRLGDRANANRPEVVFSGPHALDELISKPDASHLELSLQVDASAAFRVRAGGTDACEYWVGPPDAPLQVHDLQTRRNADLEVVRDLLPVARLRLDPSALAADHYSEQDTPDLDETGEGLASALQYLQGLQGLRDGTLEAIEADLASVVPGARRIRTLPTRIQRRDRVHVSIDGVDSWHDQARLVTGARFEVEWDQVGWVRARQLSEGTLLALGLITVLRSAEPRLVLLDDLDKGLHPVAQRELVALIRRVLDASPNLQVIATSHSPFVLDTLKGHEAFVAGSVAPGRSHIRRLDSHPAWPKRSAYLHPGEFWSAVGEDWVAESTS